MLTHQNYTLTTLRRVQDFMDANTPTLGAVATGTGRAELDAATAQLAAAGIQQGASRSQSIGETANQQTLRRALVQGQMQPIARIAKGHTDTIPPLAGLTLPPRRTDTQGVLTAAGSMGEAATPYSATFIAFGLPADFLAQLAAAATAYQTSIDSRGSARNTRVQATATTKAAMQRARHAINVVDSLVVTAIGTNQPLLTAWKNAKRVGVKLGTTSAKATPDSPVTPVAPVTPLSAVPQQGAPVVVTPPATAAQLQPLAREVHLSA